MSTFILSAFADEISPDLNEQMRFLKDLNLGYLDLRSVDGVNVLDFRDRDVTRIRETLHRNGLKVACIGSPVGKTPIDAPLSQSLDDLDRIIEIGHALDTRLIRMFSFYPPETHPKADYDTFVEQAMHRLERLIDLAERKNAILLLENEKDIVGDTLARCYRLMRTLNGPHFRFLWDPANFVQVGESRITADGWSLLGPFTGYVHIKDALLANGRVTAAGEGDGQVKALLQKLDASGYEGFLSLEPHLEQAGNSGGFSGPEKMAYAVNTLRQLLKDLGLKEYHNA